MNAKCTWCKEEFEEALYPSVQEFYLRFEVGTTSDDYGPNLSGYEIENMCTDCAWKLKDTLKNLGIEVQEVDV